jgi:transposase
MATRGIIMISKRELKRLEVLKKVIREGIKQVEAAEILELSIRQISRLVYRVKVEGEVGVVHRLRGKKSNRVISEEQKKQVIEIYSKKYKGFGPTLFSEKLFEIEKISISDETLRNWLIVSGDWEKRRKRNKHRQWRERRHYYGQMQQMDGSHHDWLEGRGPKLVLMAYIDDATGRVYCRFYEYEGTLPAMDSFLRYTRKYGLPQSVYLDKHTTYKSTGKATIEEELKGEEPLSQFERALKELGVEVIHANSPQAKGRVERLFNTLQDRLIKEMRLRGIKTQEKANLFLAEYLPIFNKKFNVLAMERGNMHMKLPRGTKLSRILCIKNQRSLRNDYTVAHDKKLYQVLDNIKTKNVTVEENVNGSLKLYYKDKSLKYKEIVTRPMKLKKMKLSDLPITIPRKKWIPPPDHPWRKLNFRGSINFAGSNSKP